MCTRCVCVCAPPPRPPVQVLSVLHLILSSPLGDEIILLQSQYFAPEHDPMELVVLLQGDQGALQGGSLLRVQRAAAGRHQVQRIVQRVRVHRRCFSRQLQIPFIRRFKAKFMRKKIRYR